MKVFLNVSLFTLAFFSDSAGSPRGGGEGHNSERPGQHTVDLPLEQTGAHDQKLKEPLDPVKDAKLRHIELDSPSEVALIDKNGDETPAYAVNPYVVVSKHTDLKKGYQLNAFTASTGDQVVPVAYDYMYASSVANMVAFRLKFPLEINRPTKNAFANHKYPSYAKKWANRWAEKFVNEKMGKPRKPFHPSDKPPRPPKPAPAPKPRTASKPPPANSKRPPTNPKRPPRYLDPHVPPKLPVARPKPPAPRPKPHAPARPPSVPVGK